MIDYSEYEYLKIEVAERVSGGIRLLIAIADVDSAVPIDSPIDRHAASETTFTLHGLSRGSGRSGAGWLGGVLLLHGIDVCDPA